MLTLDSVTLGYRGKATLSNISLTIRRGDFLGLVGPNGAGKTTLLRCILGGLTPQSGAVRWTNNERARIGYLPQRDSLDPVWPLTALDVVTMGRCALRGPLRRFSRGDRDAALEALANTGIASLAHSELTELSGGQIQRVLLARALAAEPTLLVLDEPTTGMDLGGSTAILDLIRNLHVQKNLTTLFVSHDLHAVASIASRVALLHEGAIEEGDADSILSKGVLERVYGLDIEVAAIRGKKVIVAS